MTAIVTDEYWMHINIKLSVILYWTFSGDLLFPVGNWPICDKNCRSVAKSRTTLVTLFAVNGFWSTKNRQAIFRSYCRILLRFAQAAPMQSWNIPSSICGTVGFVTRMKNKRCMFLAQLIQKHTYSHLTSYATLLRNRRRMQLRIPHQTFLIRSTNLKSLISGLHAPLGFSAALATRCEPSSWGLQVVRNWKDCKKEHRGAIAWWPTQSTELNSFWAREQQLQMCMSVYVCMCKKVTFHDCITTDWMRPFACLLTALTLNTPWGPYGARVFSKMCVI